MNTFLKHDENATKDLMPAVPHRSVSLRCDIHENATAVTIIADMPGVVTEGVDIQLHGDVLTLKGTSSILEPKSMALWCEYVARDYERTFRLGQTVDVDRIEAVIKDGVLRIELPKRAAVSPHKITVEAG